jgi:hypothetical protein
MSLTWNRLEMSEVNLPPVSTPEANDNEYTCNWCERICHGTCIK